MTKINQQKGPETPPAPETRNNKNDIAELTSVVADLAKIIESDRAARTAEMDTLSESINSLSGRVDGLQDEVNFVSDKGRLSEFDKTAAAKKPKKFKINLSTYKGKVITSWSDMMTNDVQKDKDSKKIIEDQSTTLFFADGTSEVVQYSLWQTKKTATPCLLEGKREDLESGKIFLSLIDEGGNKYEVEDKFVN